MKIRAIATLFCAVTRSQGDFLAVAAIVLAVFAPAVAQQYPPPGYPGSGQSPGYPGGQPPAYPGPEYSGPGYGGPTTAPPPLQQEVVPPPPGAAMVWTPGFWNWGRHGWIWVPGRYATRPYPYAAWVPGHWRPRGPTWVWVPGHWRR
jgi:hypothetical protein